MISLGALGGRIRGASSRASWLAPWITICVVLGLAYASGAFTGIDAFYSWRAQILRSHPTQTLTVVEIDPLSLQKAGEWPLKRERYATAIRNLRGAGARVIGLDVDFSAVSDKVNDALLTDAIGKDGDVVLATFVQWNSMLSDFRLVENVPSAGLLSGALLASINVIPDADGQLRAYSYGFRSGEAYRQTLAPTLAGTNFGETSRFLIDYGIRLDEIAKLSFQDVYANTFDPKLVRGRAILIGATALELGDRFVTPVHPALPGVYIHALAYESIVLGRALHRVSPFLVLLAAFAAVYWLRPKLDRLTLIGTLFRHFVFATVAICASILLQAFFPVSLGIAPLLAAQGGSLIWLVHAELRRRSEELMRQREASLLHLSMHDAETELPNRRALMKEISAKIEADPHAKFAVVVAGVDRFALVRGAIGYRRITVLLQQFADRLSTQAGTGRPAHLATSVLGFVLDVSSSEEAVARCNAMHRGLEKGFEIDGYAVDMIARFGVVFRGAASPDQLLEHASIALDQARQAKQNVVLFDPAKYTDPTKNLAVMSQMLSGIEAGEFSLFYQSKMETRSGRITGAEALVRWKHPKRGFVSPAEFIETAEETGNIGTLTRWCVKRAIAEGEILARQGLDVMISVNISAQLLTDRAFCDFAIAAARETSAKLCFEITETAVIENPAIAMAAIGDFRAAHVKISIDDYGAGLSSVSYLKKLNAHEVKIDKSLIDAITVSERDLLIVKSTIDLAHGLGMQAVAEGIEDEETYKLLAAIRCDMIQGYFVSKPLPFDDFVAVLTKQEAESSLRKAV